MSTSQEVEYFLNNLASAASRINSTYWTLSVAQGEPKVLERVYAYELYHQMRLLLDDSAALALHPEVSKIGHPCRDPEIVRARIPDFIFHVPREMTRNK